MARKKGLVDGFLSHMEQSNNQTTKYSEKKSVEQSDNEIFENSDSQISSKPDNQICKTVKRKEWSFKGFYISPDNNLRLKELEICFIKENKKMDLSDIINLAIEELHKRLLVT